MPRSEAIQQILMPFMLLTATIAIELRQQVRVLLGGHIGRKGFTLEQGRIQRDTIRGHGRISCGAQLIDCDTGQPE
jgi:hypothetical protein